jgi:replicative DNA helicase
MNNGKQGSERHVPYDIAAEEATIGSLLLDREAIVSVAHFLKPEDFYMTSHRVVYQAILDLFSRREPPDLATLSSELERTGKMAELGGNIITIAGLIRKVPTAVHVVYYARNVKNASILRQLISAGGEIAALGYETDVDVQDVLSQAQVRLKAVLQSEQQPQWAESYDLLDVYFKESEAIAALEDGQSVGVSTGIIDLDEVIGGMRPGELIIVGARPGVGKTALALHCARHNMNLKKPKSICFFSVEMGKATIANRLLAAQAEVDLRDMRDRRFSREQEERVVAAHTQMTGWPLAVDPTGWIRINELCNRAIARMSVHPFDLLIVDYLQRVMGHGGNREQEVADVSRRLSALAKELGVPVLVPAQLNRASEGRADKRPAMNDLRESGGIEADADVVMLMYLNEQGTMEFDVTKNRNGQPDMVYAGWNGPHQRFYDLSPRGEL